MSLLSLTASPTSSNTYSGNLTPLENANAQPINPTTPDNDDFGLQKAYEQTILSIALEVIRDADLTRQTPTDSISSERINPTLSNEDDENESTLLKKCTPETYAKAKEKFAAIYAALSEEDKRSLQTAFTNWNPENKEASEAIRDLFARNNIAVADLVYDCIQEMDEEVLRQGEKLREEYLELMTIIISIKYDLNTQQIDFLKKKELKRMKFCYFQTMGQVHGNVWDPKKPQKLIPPKLSNDVFDLKNAYKTKKMPIDADIFKYRLLIEKMKIVFDADEQTTPSIDKKSSEEEARKDFSPLLEKLKGLDDQKDPATRTEILNETVKVLLENAKFIYPTDQLKEPTIQKIEKKITILEEQKKAIKDEYKAKYAEAHKVVCDDAWKAAQMKKMLKIADKLTQMLEELNKQGSSVSQSKDKLKEPAMDLESLNENKQLEKLWEQKSKILVLEIEKTNNFEET
jgi:hypothetical protein